LQDDLLLTWLLQSAMDCLLTQNLLPAADACELGLKPTLPCNPVLPPSNWMCLQFCRDCRHYAVYLRSVCIYYYYY